MRQVAKNEGSIMRITIIESLKTEWNNARVHRLAADSHADASAAASPTPPPHSCHPCRHLLRRSDRVVVLHGRALVRVTRLPGRVLENTESSVGNFHGFFSNHIFHSVRIVSGSEAGTSRRFAERSHDSHRRTAGEAAG